MLVLADDLLTGLLARILLYAVARPLPGSRVDVLLAISLEARSGAMNRLGAHDERMSVQTGDKATRFGRCRLDCRTRYLPDLLRLYSAGNHDPQAPRAGERRVNDGRRRGSSATQDAPASGRPAKTRDAHQRGGSNSAPLVAPILGLATRSMSSRTNDRSSARAPLTRGKGPCSFRVSPRPGHVRPLLLFASSESSNTAPVHSRARSTRTTMAQVEPEALVAMMESTRERRSAVVSHRAPTQPFR